MKASILFLSLFIASFPTIGHSQIYKCVIDGKTVFSQQPCDDNKNPYKLKVPYNSSPEQGHTKTTQGFQTPNPQGKALLWFDTDMKIKKCAVYQDHDRAQREYQNSMALIDTLAPLAQSSEIKNEIESLREMKLVDSCPSGATHKCYPLLFMAGGDDSESSRKFFAEAKTKADYELWYSNNGKDSKSLEQLCQGAFETMQ